MGVGKEREGAGFVSYSMGVNVPGTLHPTPACECVLLLLVGVNVAGTTAVLRVKAPSQDQICSSQEKCWKLSAI